MASLWGTTAFGVYRGMLECVIVIIRTKIAATVDGVAPGAGVLEGAAAGTQSGLVGKRWLLGPDSYGSDLSNYRRYLVNHEFGHVLGQGLGQSSCGLARAGQASATDDAADQGIRDCRKNPWPPARDE